MEAAVLHNTWFTIKDLKGGRTFKMKYSNHGFSYSTIKIIELVEVERPKYFFFGKKIKVIRKVCRVSDSRDQNIGPIVDRRPIYTVTRTQTVLTQIMAELNNFEIVNTIVV